MVDLPQLDKSTLVVTSLVDTDEDNRYWLLQGVPERISALEIQRRMVYGIDRTTSRLQRVLETAELADLKTNKRAAGRHKDLEDLEHLQ